MPRTAIATKPLPSWRDLLIQAEAGVNQFAQRQLETGRYSPTGDRPRAERHGRPAPPGRPAAGRHLRAAGRAEPQRVARSGRGGVRRVEDKLDALLPAKASPVPRPARTRRVTEAPLPSAAATRAGKRNASR